jgi:hypothetical protein
MDMKMYFNANARELRGGFSSRAPVFNWRGRLQIGLQVGNLPHIADSYN